MSESFSWRLRRGILSIIMKKQLDKSLLLAILFLIGLGLVQVYSTSFMYAIESMGDGLFFFRKQLWFAAVSLIVLFGVAMISWNWKSFLNR